MVARASILLATVLILAVSAGAKVAAAEALPPIEPGNFGPNGTRNPGDICEEGSTTYYWSVDGWFTGSESYMVYCRPADCQDCPGGWRVKSVTMYLYWENENDCALTVSGAALAADTSIPPCQRPGAVLCEADAITAGPLNPAGLWAVTVPFPDDGPVFTGPFFARITFENTCADLPAVITNRGPVNDCQCWNEWGTDLRDLADLGFPGDLSLFARLECQEPTAVEDTTWGTIKSRYRQ